MMKNYKTLLFDLDGVLFDFNRAQEYTFTTCFNQIGVETTQSLFNYYEKINKTLWEAFELNQITKEEVTIGRFITLFKELNIKEDPVSFSKYYQSTLASCLFLCEGAKEVLEKVSQNYRLYAITNGVSKTAFSRLKGTDTLKYFKAVFVSEDLHAQKPSKAYFDQVMNAIENFELETTLIIGDSLSSDIQGACNIGCDSCWISDQSQDFTKVKPTYQIKNIKELIKILG